MQSTGEKLYSEHSVIEFIDGRMLYRPRYLAKMYVRSVPGLMPSSMKSKVLARGEIFLEDIKYFEADPGCAILVPASVSLTVKGDRSPEKVDFNFSTHYIAPGKSYCEMVRQLRRRGLPDHSEPVISNLRKLILLVIPAYILFGYWVMKTFDGFAGLLGIMAILLGGMLLAGCIIEVLRLGIRKLWRLIR